MIVGLAKTPYASAPLLINNQEMDGVPKAIYLGSILHKDRDSKVEIRGRIEMSRSAYMKHQKILFL